MNLHFIAIGGKAMHNLALSLDQKGYHITGSDDEIYDPSRTILQNAGLLPKKMGWYPSQITPKLDAIILGMHAKTDNPELIKAQELGIPIYSYPEYLYKESEGKKRIVVAGSHGKTTTTSMVMHALKINNVDHDYMVGAQLEGYERMVRISDAPIIVLEGDEYLSSPIDRRPKFLHYNPHIVIVTGIEWDHINVFPTFESYVNQFQLLIESIEIGGYVIYNENDDYINEIINRNKDLDLNYIPYNQLELDKDNQLIYNDIAYEIPLIGNHNYENLSAAFQVCSLLGVSGSSFFDAMTSFSGASRRLQLIFNKNKVKVFLDYAHAPSKVVATCEAVADWYGESTIIALLELHTYSSLNKSFLPNYNNSLKRADIAIVFYNDHTLKMKGMEELDPQFIKESFGNEDLIVFKERNQLSEYLKKRDKANSIFLFMSSGNFDNLNILPIFGEKFD